MGGVNYGWDNFEDVYDDVSFLGGVTFTASDGNSKLALPCTSATKSKPSARFPNDERFIQSIVYSRTMTDRMSWVLQSDWGGRRTHLAQGEWPNGTASTPTCSTRSTAAGRSAPVGMVPRR